MKLDDMLVPKGFTIRQAIRQAMNDDWRSRQGARNATGHGATYDISLHFSVTVSAAMANEVLDKIEAEEAAAREKSNGQMAW